MRLSRLPVCLNCDHGKKSRVTVEMVDSLPESEPQLICGSCWGQMVVNPGSTFIIKEERLIGFVERLVAKNHGDNGRTVGAFEIVGWGDHTERVDQPDYRIVLEAREAPGYEVEIQSCSQLAPLFTARPHSDEQTILRRATMPHVLVQAVDSLNYAGFRGRHRYYDAKRHWVYLDREGFNPQQRSYRCKLSWPVGG
jgi:hypothetical protein